MTATVRPASDPSLGELVSSVTTNVSSLVRLEIELAKTEVQEQVKQGAVGGGLAVVALFLVLLSTVLLSIAAGLGLAVVLPAWAAFLIVAGVYLLVAAILGLLGVRRFKRIKGPQRAAAALAETKTALANRANADRAAVDRAVASRAADLGISKPSG